MTFKDKIQSVVDSMTGHPAFLGGDWFKINIQADSAQLPAVVWINPLSGNMDFVATNATDTPNCIIAFMDKVILDANTEDAEAVTDAMKLMMVEFVARLNESPYFHGIKNLYYEISYDRLDANVIGVIMEAKVKERSGVNTCQLIKPVPVAVPKYEIRVSVECDNGVCLESIGVNIIGQNEEPMSINGEIASQADVVFSELAADTYTISVITQPEGFEIISIIPETIIIPNTVTDCIVNVHKIL